MLQFCFFLVLKRKIFHCTLYRSRLHCLEYPLHIFHHYITACKMLEHIVVHYLNKTLLHNRQHGSRKGLSCDTQLCSTYNDLAKAHDESLTTHAVVLDFKKVFDKVSHSLLLQKLRQIPEINSQIVSWVQDFITDRNKRW